MTRRQGDKETRGHGETANRRHGGSESNGAKFDVRGARFKHNAQLTTDRRTTDNQTTGPRTTLTREALGA